MRRSTLLLCALLAASGSSLSGQTPGGIRLAHPAPDPVDRGDRLHERMRPLEALEAYREVLAREPESHQALWRAAREAVSLGMIAADESAGVRWYEEAERYARRAVEIAPEAAEGHLWLAVAAGRRALHEGTRTRARLGYLAREKALEVLSMDSLAPAAHHVLGQWHAEVMRLSPLARFMAARLPGNAALGEASWEMAEHHLARAAELAPHALIHHLELGRVYLDRGRPEEAEAHLREVRDRPALDPADPVHKQAAQELMVVARRRRGDGQGNRLRAPLMASSTRPFTSSARSSQRSPAVSRISPATRRSRRRVRRPVSGAVSRATPAPITAPRISPEMKLNTCAS